MRSSMLLVEISTTENCAPFLYRVACVDNDYDPEKPETRHKHRIMEESFVSLTDAMDFAEVLAQRS